VLPFVLGLLLFTGAAHAWTVNDRCELVGETPEGPVAVAAMPDALLLYPPAGLVENDDRVRVAIGKRVWNQRVVGGTLVLAGATRPFLEHNRVSLRADGDQLLAFSLLGSAAAWQELEDCDPPPPTGWFTLSGEVSAATDDEIVGAIRRQRPEGLILDSPGGLAREAQRIGTAVRRAAMATKVASDGRCLSECLFILAAGAPRTVDPGAMVGLRPSLVTGGLGVFRPVAGPVVDSAVYFSGMGVDGGKLAILAMAAGRDELHLLSVAELKEAGLSNDGANRAATSLALGGSSEPKPVGSWWLLALLAVAALLWVATRPGRSV
jgi:hypothetical protein